MNAPADYQAVPTVMKIKLLLITITAFCLVGGALAYGFVAYLGREHDIPTPLLSRVLIWQLVLNADEASSFETCEIPVNQELLGRITAMYEEDRLVTLEHLEAEDSVLSEPFREARTKTLVSLVTDGWMHPCELGRVGTERLWRLAQHSPDPDFRQQALDVFQDWAASGYMRKDFVAIMTDRVLLSKGEAQIYGTQLKCEASGPKAVNLYDSSEVDERRRRMGLYPLRLDLRMMRHTYCKQEHRK